MPTRNIFRIYTEEKNKRNIVRLAGKAFDNFTLQPTLGYYNGKPEKSIVIEIVGAREPAVKELALKIRKMNGQKSVLIMKLRFDHEAAGPSENLQNLARRNSEGRCPLFKRIGEVHE